MEVELKLLLDPAPAAALRRHPLLRQHAIAKPRQQLTSIYFDTPDLHFRRHDAALRVRKVSESGGHTQHWVQTLKGGGQVAAGLHQRAEWESRVGGPQPELGALIALVGPGSAWAKVLSAQALTQRLTPIFTTRVRRTTWLLRLPQGDEIELALDQGTMQHDAAQEPISEIELELMSGDPARLFDVALALLKTVPLRVGNVSKAERGYALHAPQPPAVVEAAPLELAPGLTVEQGFQAITRHCLAQLQGNEAGVAQGHDPESVHQMRVGLRRLRSACLTKSRLARTRCSKNLSGWPASWARRGIGTCWLATRCPLWPPPVWKRRRGRPCSRPQVRWPAKTGNRQRSPCGRCATPGCCFPWVAGCRARAGVTRWRRRGRMHWQSRSHRSPRKPWHAATASLKSAANG